MLENYLSNKKYELAIVGAGPVGAVIAERAATVLGWNVIVIDKRKHIAGNCYDRFHDSGVLIHQYGPHYFRTDKPEILKYLSSFTEWIPGNYIVKSSVKNEFYPFPINLDTLRKFFNLPNLSSSEAYSLLDSKRIKIDHPANSEDFVRSRVGDDLYQTFYKPYTFKQWGIYPKDLAPSVCGRIPIRYNRDPRYVNNKFQLTPKDGFTNMFSNILKNPRINTLLGQDFQPVKGLLSSIPYLVYTGPIDEYFDYQYGKLPWRSLDFKFESYNTEYVQKCVQINYPEEFEYTRSVEIKHVTRQIHPNTVVSYETPKSLGDPYYPIPSHPNEDLYKKYLLLANEENKNRNAFFCGRLAEYKYYNTDEVIERALSTFELIKQSLGNK